MKRIHKKELTARRARIPGFPSGRNPGVFRGTALALVPALLLAAFLTGAAYQKTEAAAAAGAQRHLAGEVLRFHVLADSDSREDQAVKLKVRDGVLGYLETEMPELSDAGETALWIRRHIDEIEEVSREIVSAEGKDDPVNAAVTTCWFPEKSYGDVTFPAGNYEALRIEIGAAERTELVVRSLSGPLLPRHDECGGSGRGKTETEKRTDRGGVFQSDGGIRL